MIALRHSKGSTHAVFGLARSGLATARALVAGGAEVRLWDDNEASRLAAEQAGFKTLPLNDATLAGCAALVLAPGVPLTHPVPHDCVAAAKRVGVPVIGDVELLLRELSPVVYGITGTNGKSTTTALLGHVLNAAGRSIAIGGKPLTSGNRYDHARAQVARIGPACGRRACRFARSGAGRARRARCNGRGGGTRCCQRARCARHPRRPQRAGRCRSQRRAGRARSAAHVAVIACPVHREGQPSAAAVRSPGARVTGARRASRMANSAASLEALAQLRGKAGAGLGGGRERGLGRHHVKRLDLLGGHAEHQPASHRRHLSRR